MGKPAALFLVFILLNTTFSLVFAQETVAPPEETTEGGFTCEISSLTEQESQNIINLLKEGFVGDEIRGNTRANTDRDELATNELVLTDPEDRNVAARISIPNKKFEAWEMSQFLNEWIKGPFAFGLVLEDSLRAGRCKEYDGSCALVGANLKYRNSGAGIVENFRNVWEDLKDFWDGNRSMAEFSEEENEILRTRMQIEDKNKLNMKVVNRLETEMIPNSILTDRFEAKMETNCTSSACVLSTYSMFDKYFNSYMSAEMVTSNFGPMVLYRLKKLFGWTGRRLSFLRKGWNKFGDKFRRNFETSDSLLGSMKLNRMHQRVDKHGLHEWYDQLLSGDPRTEYYLVKTSDFQSWWAKQSAKGGFLDKIDTLEKRDAFIRVLKDMRTSWHAGEANLSLAENTFKSVAKRYGANSPQAREALVDYGREMARWMNVVDDQLKGDLPWWFLNTNYSQFYDKGVRSINTGEIINLNDDPRHFRRILDKFVNDGQWKGFEGEKHVYDSVYETAKIGGVDTGFMQLYGFDEATQQAYRGLSYSNLERAAKDIKNIWAKTDYGEFIRYNPQTVPLIQSRIAGNATLVQGTWKPIMALTPEEMAMRLTNARTRQNMKVALNNIDEMLDTVKERNWVSRRYWSALDKLFAQEDELVKSYFSIKGGVKWTAYPYGYWWVKRGVGIEDISMYQLPDDWKEVTFYLGEEDVYNDAYIDFFANEGSDQGDIFVQVLNKLPWKLIYDELSKLYAPVKNFMDALTKNELRNEAEDLAFYLTGPDECTGCTMVLRSENLEDFSPFFASNQTLDSYILEDTRTDKAKKKGQTIIAYAHHTNLKGETSDIEGEEIDLVKAKKEKKTCMDVLENDLELLGVNYGKIMPKGPAVAGVIYGMETLSYLTFFWSGIFATAAMMILVAPKFQDCVDYDEGYYVHYFIPTEKEESEQEDVPELSTEKFVNFVGGFKDMVVGSFTGDNNNTMTRSAVEEIGEEIDRFVGNAKDNKIVQAKLSVFGQTTGQLTGRKLFYFWCGEGCEMHAAEYKTQGKEVLSDSNRGISLEIDYENGVLSQNGVPIVTNPDAVRMISLDTRIPAEEIPKTLTTACISESSDTAIEINARGEAFVKHPELLGCIQEGVEAQTGMGFTGENLYNVFGRAEAVITDTHPQIKPMDEKIIAEGVPRKIATGRNEKIIIMANKDVNLTSSNDNLPYVGRLRSIQFKNGSIVVKPDGCFLVWLRHHEKGILNQNDVKGLKTDLTTSKNPETECEEPAINLEIQGDPNSPYSMQKAAEFNEALDHVGPFQVFETPTKRYILYMGPPPECEEHLRIIDKETGEITDYKGDAVETPEGLKFIEDDGTEHSLNFGAKDGVPYVQFDGGKPETLTAAQGRNGSFWYDPEKGLWYAENGQLLPLLEAFRKGIGTQVGPNGEVTSTATGNVLNLELGGEGAGFLNLPSLPEQAIYLMIFIAGLIVVIAGIRIKLGRRKKS